MNIKFDLFKLQLQETNVFWTNLWNHEALNKLTTCNLQQNTNAFSWVYSM